MYSSMYPCSNRLKYTSFLFIISLYEKDAAFVNSHTIHYCEQYKYLSRLKLGRYWFQLVTAATAIRTTT